MHPDAHALLTHLATLPASRRDAAVEARLGIADGANSEPPGDSLIGYHPSGLAPIVRSLLEVPVTPEDVLIDLGCGLGKVVLLAEMLTGATGRGIEIRPALVRRARACAARMGARATFVAADVRDAPLDDGTVFYLYDPFTGEVVDQVLARLRRVAEAHAIVVCALGIDLDVSWLVPRALDSFWLTIYDSAVDGVPLRGEGGPSPLPVSARALAFERG